MYRTHYQPGETNGFAHGLKMIFDAASFARLAAAISDPFSASETDAKKYASNYFQYDAQHRATLEVAQGGCSCSGNNGQGTYTYSYALNPYSSVFLWPVSDR